MSELNESLVLVGFGKHDLKEMIGWINDPVKEEDLIGAFRKWPPRYRRLGICSNEDIEACVIYTTWLAEQVDAWEKENKVKISQEHLESEIEVD